MKLLSALFLALMVVGLLAGPALATEAAPEAGASEAGASEGAEEEEPLTIEDVGQDNEVAQQFFPESKEQPTVFPPILYGLLGAGLLIAVVLFVMYLSWLPRFNRERREKRR